MSEVTRILAGIEAGDPHAAEQLLPLVYQELRKLAAQKLAQEKPGQTHVKSAVVDGYRSHDVVSLSRFPCRGISGPQSIQADFRMSFCAAFGYFGDILSN
jgi:hypothetical protein